MFDNQFLDLKLLAKNYAHNFIVARVARRAQHLCAALLARRIVTRQLRASQRASRLKKTIL